jgi:SAM-dependent methyltransferase
MPGSKREQVRANAQYLRSVRPVDPEEIAEYVEGQPHPAVVRQLLREDAVDLGLVERDDGTFVPVAEGPVSPTFRGVTALPEAYSRVVEDLLVERYGPDWHRGESGDRLRETIRRLKADYYRQRDVAYDADVALAYTVYHLADYYAVAQYVLDVLGGDGLLDHSLRVLDVGAGVGGPALGLHDYLPGAALVDYHAVEPSAAADALDALLDETGPNFHATVHRETAEAFEPPGAYDLVCFCNVLSELDDPEAVVRRYADRLADDGTMVLVAPADRNTSVHLREVERAVGGDAVGGDRDDSLTVYAPTVRLWPGEQPSDEGWSFDEQPDVEVPAFQRRLAEAAADPGEFTNTSIKFSYSLLRRDGRRRIAATADPARHAKMADMERHVTERVDLLAAKLSRDLADGGNPVFKVSDGSESVSHYAVLVKETGLNADLAAADYGDLLAFERALALWNDDEGAYNLVVDEETAVDRVPAG